MPQAPPTPTMPPAPPAGTYYSTPPPVRRGPNGCIIALLVLLGSLVVLSLLVFAARPFSSQSRKHGFSGHGSKIAVIDISGVIMEQGSSSFLGVSGGMRSVMEYIREAAADDSVKAVILRIDSPGGSAAASQAVYSEVMKLRIKKPVIASMGDVAASGGYYIAAAANAIVASPATTTGSIGVIFSGINYGDLAKKYGVTDDTITSGAFKDSGNPMRAMRPDERKLFVDLVKEVYEQFLTDVASGRKMDKAKLRKLADGRVYTGSQAKRVGLVDELGNYYDAIDLAAKKAGITGKPNVVEYGLSGGLFQQLLGSKIQFSGASPIEKLMTAQGSLPPGLWTILAGHEMVLAN